MVHLYVEWILELRGTERRARLIIMLQKIFLIDTWFSNIWRPVDVGQSHVLGEATAFLIVILIEFYKIWLFVVLEIFHLRNLYWRFLLL